MRLPGYLEKSRIRLSGAHLTDSGGTFVSTFGQTSKKLSNNLWLIPNLAQCTRCGAQTDLYLIGIAICALCDELIRQLAADLNSKRATPELFVVKKKEANG
jgi:hypothetical protein